MSEVIQADLTWTRGAFHPAVQVEIDKNGRIQGVGRLNLKPTLRLQGQALIPGFVNAHSHAFQRGIRSSAEKSFSGSEDFWSWREAMYKYVANVTPETFFSQSLNAFREMRRSGITTVGEFHYLHHSRPNGSFDLDTVLLDAASEAGIRLALLNTFYQSDAFGKPLVAAQEHFFTRSLEEFLVQHERLADSLDSRRHSLGIAAHSMRAVSIREIVALYEEAVERGIQFHIHLEEQEKEIQMAVAQYGKPPVVLLDEALQLSRTLTAVHCTQTSERDLARLVKAGASLCICPTTEGNLGDGLAEVGEFVKSGGRVCLGTDSNCRISMLEEMRWLEYGQRLRKRARGVVRTKNEDVAKRLLEAGTLAGAIALGVEAGEIAVGKWADFAVIDLSNPILAEWSRENLVEMLIFGADTDVIAGTFVGGTWDANR